MKSVRFVVLLAFSSYGCATIGSDETSDAGTYPIIGLDAGSDAGEDAYTFDDWDVGIPWYPWLDGGATDTTVTPETCAEGREVAKLDDVYMAFAFDVSGSMGKGDKCYHKKEEKWDPVSQAASAFLEETPSTGLWASMTFFPAMDDKCEDFMYLSPSVPFTQLPSTAFREAFEFIIATEGFRGRTPTLHVLRGVLHYVRKSRDQSPGRYVIVLVTDGMPEHCSDNSISSVVTLVAEAAADEIPTYVIGINNPPCGPKTLDDLNEIAVGGDTENAFLIDTGDPEKTANDFNDVVESIRDLAVSCTIVIPEMPPGKQFDKRAVEVVYKLRDTEKTLVYDGDCQQDSDNTWRYDDVAQPTKIVLCEKTCDLVKSDPETTLELVFLCEPVILL